MNTQNKPWITRLVDAAFAARGEYHEKHDKSFLYLMCECVAKTLPVRHILKNDAVPGAVVNQADVYLSRHYIWPNYDPMHHPERPRPPLAVHLHHFNRSDSDFELHNHPFEWAVALILTGGYREERRVVDPTSDTGYKIEEHILRPGDFNLILADDFHRAELLDKALGAWTLFVTGPRVQDWGFWCREKNEFTPWKPFIQRRHPPAINKDRADD